MQKVLNNHKGSIIRLCGVVFLFVGILDSMLLWRGGLVGHGFYFILIATGLLLYAVGSIVRQRSDANEDTPLGRRHRGSGARATKL